ncbi:Cation diffusion facilitator [Mycena indigotica]|uniref:Cation diffusion facilitator n=1 Tax=Mycena indigotica TaxID=2126181 RepID=A0A8H6VZ27_9AGAR|nr:Cation diffusion facilitator [Mycena indigotica]KAF7297121.1 Cation diffusion facilitator [Mycena indigotica]
MASSTSPILASAKRRRPTMISGTFHPALGHDMIHCPPQQFESFRKSADEIKGISKRQVRAFYERQNEILDGLLEVEGILGSKLPDTVFGTFSRQPILEDGPLLASPIAENGDDAERQPLLGESKEKQRERADKIALNVNIAVNILLLGTKGFAVLLSSSVSLLASFVDSALDFLSTLIIWGAALASNKKDDSTRFVYPTGKKRFEPLGVLIFSVCMIASFSQVLVESLRKLFVTGDDHLGTVSLFGKITMIATIVIKSVIWIWCAKFQSSSIQALAQDAKNDVFFNTFSLIIPWVGELLSIKQLDPLGGAFLSIYIIVEWIRTLLENFTKLSGKIASNEHHARVLYLVSKFNPVQEISYLEVYHVGDELIVEVDIILPSSTSLPYAHDVGETIQASIEALELVSRAYVHLDYSSDNPAQHGGSGV